MIKAFRIFYISLAALLLGIWLFQIQNERSAIKATEEWVRVAPINACDDSPQVETAGSMFTREFFIEFTCDPLVLKEWVANSPGLKEANITKQGNRKHIYIIEPGGGAISAKAEIDWSTNIVNLHAVWG